MKRRLFHLTVLFLLLFSFLPIRTAKAQQLVPVTVTIYRLVQIDDPDEGKPFSVAGDFFSRVRINGFPFQDSGVVSIDPGFGEGVIYSLPVTFEPFWRFTQNVDLALGSTTVEIQIWDEDNPGFPLFDDHDQVDINPIGGVRNVILIVNLNTGDWTGDVPMNQGFTQGGGDSDRSLIFFDISIQSPDGDADGDGLLDGWEANGLDNNADGIIDVDLPGMGANPNHKDLFLELDWMAGNAPTRAAIQNMKTAFANAPINAGTNAAALPNGVNAKNNPDGLPGINIWVDTGNLTDSTAAEDGAAANSCGDGVDNGGDGVRDAADPDCRVGDNFGGGNQLNAVPIPALDASFYTAKQNNFNANRRLIFRYAISAAPGFEDGSAAGNSCFDGVDNGGGDENGDGNPEIDGNDPDCWPWGGGWGEIGGNDFIEYNHDGGTIMHELGHTLNLHHGGNVDGNCKPNYVSVMNYDLQFGIPQNGGAPSILDYSPPRFPGGRAAAPLGNLVENNLSETNALDNTDTANQLVFTNSQGRKVRSPVRGVDIDGNGVRDGYDFDNDGAVDVGPLTVNIDTADNNGTATAADDRPGACINNSNNSTLTGHDDWTRIALQFRQFGDAANGAIHPVTEPEISLPDLLHLQVVLNTADLSLTKTDAPDPAIAGEDLAYTLTVTNNGPNPASKVQVTDNLPAGVTFLNSTTACVENPARTITCDLGEIMAKQSRAFEIRVKIAADLVYNAGGPTTITNQASVINLAGPDPNSGNNSVNEDTLVKAVADLEIVSFSAVDPPKEVMVGEDFKITLKKVITNNGPSAPMDTYLTGSAIVPSDVTISPPTLSIQEMALALDEQRTVLETYTLQCKGYSHHLFTFKNEIWPLHPEDTDPNQANNTAEITLDVECVVPVTINIKPGGYPNSINPFSRGVTPLAILTTKAGEYGNPLAFDTSRIDPLSVRFGTREEIWSESGGASEYHDKGHPEDSYELDEVTQDGDMDLVMHFKTRLSGIIPETKEACVKGTWIDQNGNAHKFFGCDSVRTVPPSHAKSDLVLSMVVSDPAPDTGSEVTFKLHIANMSTKTTGGIIVQDVLPSGLQLVSSSADIGGYAADIHEWVIGELKGGQSASLTLVARVLPTGNFANYVEIIASDEEDIDSLPDNQSLDEDDNALVILSHTFLLYIPVVTKKP